MPNSLAQDRSAGSPLAIATSRLAKDVTPDRMAAMLDELGVEDSWNVVEDAAQIVAEARREFSQSWKAEMRKATIIAVVGIIVAVAGVVSLFNTPSDLPTVAAIVGGVIGYRGLKRRDQLGRQSFRNTYRYSA